MRGHELRPQHPVKQLLSLGTYVSKYRQVVWVRHKYYLQGSQKTLVFGRHANQQLEHDQHQPL